MISLNGKQDVKAIVAFSALYDQAAGLSEILKYQP
jgi:hypothetical protein